MMAQHLTPCLAPGRRHGLRAAAMAALLGLACGWSLPAWAVEFGPLRLLPASGPASSAEIVLTGQTSLDVADIRARLATPDAYQVAGMRYQDGLRKIVVTPRNGPGGQVVLQLAPLPAPDASGQLDLLLLVGDRMSLTMGEYSVQLNSGTREFAAAKAGSRLAEARPPRPAGTVVSSATSPATRGADAPVPAAASLDEATRSAVQAAVQAWAQAWSRRDMAAYVGAYVPDHAGRSGSHEAWVALRKSRIESKSSIEVAVSDLQLAPRGDKVVATFSQRYRGDRLVENGRKRLVMASAGGRWLIQEEAEIR